MIRKHSDLVEFIGEVDDQGKQELLGNALAFIFPSSWAEPFGVVMIEAMACGTPVIARNRGSVPEIIEPGVSGLLFKTIEEGVEAVNKIGQIDRAKVRKAFDQRFTVEAMVDGYEKVLNRAANGTTPIGRLTPHPGTVALDAMFEAEGCLESDYKSALARHLARRLHRHRVSNGFFTLRAPLVRVIGFN
uniref:Glycos_transf_1 domain-containing protein n=1 Tax=Globodera pallida TaxID=36090 RepID=A0A183BR93_GLOPA